MVFARLAAILAFFGGLGLASTMGGIPAWNGEENPARGKGWSEPAVCRVQPTFESPHGGKRCLRIDLKGEGWKGVGWNWFGWYPPEAATDARDADNLVFWLRSSRSNAAIEVRLVDNQKKSSALINLMEKGILRAVPTVWSEVRVPLSAFGGGFDASRLWELDFGTSAPGDLTLWVDDIAFEKSPARGADDRSAANAFKVNVSVDPDRVLHPINPFIFGVSAVESATAKEHGVTTVRWGGNRSSRYSWKARADNAGSDWFFLNGKAGRWDEFVSLNRRAGLESYVTVPLLPWVAKSAEGWGFSVAKYGPQQKSESYVPDRGNGVRPDGSPISGNDPRDTSIPATAAFQAAGIKPLGAPGGPPIVYGLDNEPMLWHATHRDVHPAPATFQEVFTRGRDYALAIKAADPKGLTAGPCTWGWTDLQFSAADAAKDNYATHADRRAHGDQAFLAWYLAAMKKASGEAGKRLLDFVDVHYYPQGQADGQGVYGGSSKSAAMRSLRLRSTRALWDPSYRDESWIREPVMLIPRVRGWIDANNPGTKLCIGEYNWGGDDDPSGAVAQAEILGIFAREGVDRAYLWAGLAGVQRFAFSLYRNADGAGHGFGERYLACRSDQPDRLSVFAARRADGKVTVVLVNKDLDRKAEVRLVFGSKIQSGGTVFLMPNPPGPIKKEAIVPGGQGIAVEVQPMTALMWVGP